MQPILNHIWQSTLFVAAAWLITLALRKNRAQARYWVWLVASVKFALPFSMLIWLGSQVSWRTATMTPQPMPIITTEHAVQLRGTPTARATVSHTGMPELLFLIWACGFIAISVRWARRWARMNAEVRASRAVNVEFPIPVKISAALLEPGVFGVFRPVLLLPEGIMETLAPAQLRTVLAHELCHVRRRDNLAMAMHSTVQALFWFHPPVWWIGAKLIEERERACDEEVLRGGSDPETYAEGILSVCKLYLASPLECVAGVSGSNLNRRIEEIMTNRIAPRIDLPRRALLVAAGVLAIIGPLVIGLMEAPPLRAQAQPSQSAFEVASIRTWTGGEIGGVHNNPGGLLEFRGCTLQYLVQEAFNVQPFQISGGPGWKNDDRFNIDAKPPASSESSHSNPPYWKWPMNAEQRGMLQSLLAERFHFEYRRESREGPVYVLTRGSGPLKLTDSKDKNEYPWAGAVRGGALSGDGLRGINESMDDLAWRLAPYLDRLVLNRTELAGSYDFLAKYPEEDGRADRVGMILATLKELGLKLEAGKGPIETIVIEHVEKPSAN